MHAEFFEISGAELDAIARSVREGRPIVPVGTTAVRTLESVYWLGVRALRQTAPTAAEGFFLPQWEAYSYADDDPLASADAAAALEALSQSLRDRGQTQLYGRTSLCIIPGYRFRLCDALVTNFHTPDSTLLLLVGALLGRQPIAEAYSHAVASGYRFLSYGDATLLIPAGEPLASGTIEGAAGN